MIDLLAYVTRLVIPTGATTSPRVEIGTDLPTDLVAFYALAGETAIAGTVYYAGGPTDPYTYDILVETGSGAGVTALGGRDSFGVVRETSRIGSGIMEFLQAQINIFGATPVELNDNSYIGLNDTSDLRMFDAGTSIDMILGSFFARTGSLVEIEPGAAFVIDGVSAPRSLAGEDFQTGNSAAVTAETVVHTIANMVFVEGRAYRITCGSRVETSNANGRARFRLRKTNAAGAQWGDLGTIATTGTAGDDCATPGSAVYLVRAAGAGSDLTATLVLTLEHLAGGANTATMLGSATNPRYLVAHDVGASGDYPGALAVT